MYRERLEKTPTKSQSAQNLQRVMLAYNDFLNAPSIDKRQLYSLAEWQTARLKQTHFDLYQSPTYQSGLKFLLSDLYAPQDFSDRDRDLERIFPKMVKLLPDKILDTVALLIELNLLTQKLDHKLAQAIYTTLQTQKLSESIYCEAYRMCDNYEDRNYQINLIGKVGIKLDKYARSSLINFSLKISEKPAEMAGLSALHGFIQNGFTAFYGMENIENLMSTLVQRELGILDRIYGKHENPFQLNTHSPL